MSQHRKSSIQYIRKVLDRLERRGWSQWKQQIAFEELAARRRG
jgi:hypothetical protein